MLLGKYLFGDQNKFENPCIALRSKEKFGRIDLSSQTNVQIGFIFKILDKVFLYSQLTLVLTATRFSFVPNFTKFYFLYIEILYKYKF